MTGRIAREPPTPILYGIMFLMQNDNTNLLEALKHPGRPDAEQVEVRKEPRKGREWQMSDET